jgi:hypothetical protein
MVDINGEQFTMLKSEFTIHKHGTEPGTEPGTEL